MPKPPPTLYRVHKVMIVSGIALCVLFAVRDVGLVMRGEASGIFAVLAFSIAAGLAVYLRAFTRKFTA